MPCFEYNVDPYQPASQKVTDQNQLFTTLPLNQPFNLILCNTYAGKLGLMVHIDVFNSARANIDVWSKRYC